MRSVEILLKFCTKPPHYCWVEPLKSNIPPTDPVGLADDFGRFFVQNIDNIRCRLDTYNIPLRPMVEDEPRYSGTLFNEFQFVPAENVKRMIFSSLNKSCDSDRIPTDIVKECIDETSYYQLPLAWLTCLLTLTSSQTSGRRLLGGQSWKKQTSTY